MWIVNLAPRIVDASQSTWPGLNQIPLGHLNYPRPLIVVKPNGVGLSKFSGILKLKWNHNKPKWGIHYKIPNHLWAMVIIAMVVIIKVI